MSQFDWNKQKMAKEKTFTFLGWINLMFLWKKSLKIPSKICLNSFLSIWKKRIFCLVKTNQEVKARNSIKKSCRFFKKNQVKSKTL